MTVESEQAGGRGPGADFGRQLRAYRRRAGLTQQQLGRMVGYHHSLISRLEAGLREPAAGLVRLLDSVLGAGGGLDAAGAADGGRAPAGLVPCPSGPGLYGVPPGDGTAIDGPAGSGPPGCAPAGPGPLGAKRAAARPAGLGPGPDPRPRAGLPAAGPPAAGHAGDPLLWPAALPAEGLACPVHGTAGCAVCGPAELPALLGELTAPQPRYAALAGRETDALHALTAALAGLIRGTLEDAAEGPGDGVAAVERLLRAVLRWAEAVHSGGRLPLGQLRIAAQYAQIAGRLRMQRGQSVIGMAWFGHGLRWAEAAGDAPARATLLSDSCALVRLDEDAALTLGYARAIGAVDSRRRWIATLSHLYQARGHALGEDAAECRRHIALARREFARLGAADHREAPWLAGAEGEMRLESSIGGALRDLAAATGDRTTARRAAEAVASSRDRLAPRMRGTRLLLTVRLADTLACAGDPAAAVELVAPLLPQVLRSRELLVGAELSGLHGRLLGGWAGVPEVRRYREQLLDSAPGTTRGFAGL